jgi:hypothetical protein
MTGTQPTPFQPVARSRVDVADGSQRIGDSIRAGHDPARGER